ncbi:MAG: PilW family protein [Xanthomonadales bacterium]|nr:PilW family protein [Xanthomonadales bacterium]
MSGAFRRSLLPARPASGLSLIELMVGLAIGAILTIGLLQIFSASRVSSQTQEGLSRVQENGRFAIQYIQRGLRQVGYTGCGTDVARARHASFVNHLSNYIDGSVPGGPQYRFQRQLDGFRAGVGTAPGEFSAITPVANTDVLIMRVFGEDRVPVLSTVRTNTNRSMDIVLADGTLDFLPEDGKLALFAMQNCRSSEVFAGKISGNKLIVEGTAAPNVYGDPSATDCGLAACPWAHTSNAFQAAKPLSGGPARLNVDVQRAEYMALFVMNRPDTSTPALYMRRFQRDSTTLGSPEELVEGVENMQLRYGFDTDDNGTADEYRTAAEVVAGAVDDGARDVRWRQVVSVRVALLLRSPDRAAVPSGTRKYSLLGTEVTPPDDGAMRQVYETTIALRNRMFNT